MKATSAEIPRTVQINSVPARQTAKISNLPLRTEEDYSEFASPLGLERGLLDQLHSLSETSVPEMRIQLHIDGMKIFKGSSQGLWPILARVRHPVVGQPFIVGVFSGPGKPDPLDDFLGDCVGELKDLLASGLHIPHKQNSVKVILDKVICDTPARCFVRQVKAHNGYYGCDRCIRLSNS
nr:unnamed protein product [Spirometra erinaceieuropaei]